MAKKKVKKKSSAKKVVKKKTVSKKKSINKPKVVAKRKIVDRNIFTFLILFAFSVVLYYATSPGILNDIFYFAIIIFGSLVLAFLIIRLIIFFLRVLKKK